MIDMTKVLGAAIAAVGFFSMITGAAAVDPEKKELVFGATVGDFSDVVTQGLTPVLEKQGYTVRLVQFTDYVQPNIALAEGRLDANIFQHKPYLDQFAEVKGLDLTAIAQVPTAPLGLYQGKKKALVDVAEGSTVSVPNDPSNLARALVMLQDIGWIKLPEGIDPFKVSPRDIVENPKKIVIRQLEAAQLPRSVEDVDFAIVNGNYAVSSGMDLSAALYQEKSDAYVNWTVVKTADKNRTFTADITSALSSPEFKAWAREKFKGYKYPANW